MATASTVAETVNSPDRSGAGMLVTVTPVSADALERTCANLQAAFPEQPLQVVTPTALPAHAVFSPHLRVLVEAPAAPSPGGWLLTAADFLSTYKSMQDHDASGCLMLGPEAESLTPQALAALGSAMQVGHADLTMPGYALGPRDGLVNSAILYPSTRALFGTRPRYPLAIDLAFSRRMGERLAMTAQKFTATGQNNAIVWPVAEAATAGFTIAEVDVGHRAIPAPDTFDLNTVLAHVAGSLFSDIEAKATFWQRARAAYSPKAAAAHTQAAAERAHAEAPPEMPDIQPMLDSFRIAYSNLHEIWSLVLPPNSLLGLKKLSLMSPAEFRMPDALWARIVYDFILAYRLRTINRGHLMGALTPLYLAWVASHLRLVSAADGNSVPPETHIEALAAAFETDKPYLVARWRWPDRFNP